MESKNFPKSEDAVAFANELLVDNVVQGVQNQDGSITISWVARTTYVAQDGKEYSDEVWFTRNGKMIAVGNLSDAHAKNILRMVIRQDREYADALKKATKEIAESLPENIELITGKIEYIPEFKGLLDETLAPEGTLLN